MQRDDYLELKITWGDEGKYYCIAFDADAVPDQEEFITRLKKMISMIVDKARYDDTSAIKGFFSIKMPGGNQYTQLDIECGEIPDYRPVITGLIRQQNYGKYISYVKMVDGDKTFAFTNPVMGRTYVTSKHMIRYDRSKGQAIVSEGPATFLFPFNDCWTRTDYSINRKLAGTTTQFAILLDVSALVISCDDNYIERFINENVEPFKEINNNDPEADINSFGEEEDDDPEEPVLFGYDDDDLLNAYKSVRCPEIHIKLVPQLYLPDSQPNEKSYDHMFLLAGRVEYNDYDSAYSDTDDGGYDEDYIYIAEGIFYNGVVEDSIERAETLSDITGELMGTQMDLGIHFVDADVELMKYKHGDRQGQVLDHTRMYGDFIRCSGFEYRRGADRGVMYFKPVCRTIERLGSLFDWDDADRDFAFIENSVLKEASTAEYRITARNKSNASRSCSIILRFGDAMDKSYSTLETNKVFIHLDSGIRIYKFECRESIRESLPLTFGAVRYLDCVKREISEDGTVSFNPDAGLRDMDIKHLKSIRSLKDMVNNYGKIMYLRSKSLADLEKEVLAHVNAISAETDGEKDGYDFSTLRKHANSASQTDLMDAIRNRIEFTNPGYEIKEQTLNELNYQFEEWRKFIYMLNEAKVENVSDFIVRISDRYDSISELPNPPRIALMGEAGTGKTTLARIIAQKCLGAVFKEVTGTQLMPAYQGQTKDRVAEVLSELLKDKDPLQPAVLFIDEAYNLFEDASSSSSPNSYASELIDILLPIMTSDGEYVLSSDRHEGNADGSRMAREVKIPANFAIWLGGYEDRLRKAFSANEGLYRRFSTVVIPTPKMTELSDLFWKTLQSDEAVSDDVKKNVTVDLKNELKTFLGWASSRTYSRLFANRAGIITLEGSVRRYLSQGYELDEAVRLATERIRGEISRQYSVQLMKEFDELPFEVINDIDVTFDDYAGYEELKNEMNEVIEMMTDPDIWKKRHITMPKGALLKGSPGTGKSYLARCFAGQLMREKNRLYKENSSFVNVEPKDIAFVPIAAAQILAQHNPVNVIKLLFSEASKYDAAVIFIDELDAIGRDRNLPGTRVDVLTQLMIEMDGFCERSNVFVLAATNDPDHLDGALKREGRFDISFEIDIPDKSTSRAIIDMYLRKYGLQLRGGRKKSGYTVLSKKEEDRIISLLGGETPAFIASVINDAALLYHRTETRIGSIKINDAKKDPRFAHRMDNGKLLKTKKYNGTLISNVQAFLKDLKETIDISRIGRRNEVGSDKGFDLAHNDLGPTSVAIHEVGHALMGRLLKGSFAGTERITILGRGDAGGYVEHSRDEIRLITKKDYMDRIKMVMGGRVAEEVVYGADEVSVGASDDIRKARNLARDMVERFGFSEEIGFMGMTTLNSSYLGASIGSSVSEEMRCAAEREEQKILKECMQKTRQMLGSNKKLIIALAKKIFDLKEITGAQMEEIYNKSVREKVDR